MYGEEKGRAKGRKLSGFEKMLGRAGPVGRRLDIVGMCVCLRFGRLKGILGIFVKSMVNDDDRGGGGGCHDDPKKCVALVNCLPVTLSGGLL
jgi:hypothetical protein